MRLTTEYRFLLPLDSGNDMDNQLVSHTLFPNKDSVGKLVEWYKEKTNSLIKQKSLSYDGVPGKYIDIIKNVINLAAIHFAADKLVSGILAYYFIS